MWTLFKSSTCPQNWTGYNLNPLKLACSFWTQPIEHNHMHVVSSNPIKPRRIHMSRKLFTEEQIAALRQNPYVYSVSRSTLVLRKSFKEIFYTEYMEGVYPKDVFKKYGFDPAVLGERRIGGALQHIKEEYAKYGCFYEGRRPADRSDTAAKVKPEDDIKALRHEVEYLRQEVEYLKKISAIKNTKR